MVYTPEERTVARRDARKRWQRRNSEKQRAYKVKWTEENKVAVAKNSRAYYVANKPRINKYALAHRLKQFGLTLADYERMNREQKGACAICGETPTTRRLDVDHCHASGRVRGLLCRQCNHALGFLKDDLKRIASAAAYLLNN